MAWKKTKSGSRPKIYSVNIKGEKIYKLKEWKKNNPGKIYFDSDFERKSYLLLEAAGFNFEFQPTARELIPPLKSFALSKGKPIKLFRSSVRPLSYTMDFVVHCDNGTDIFLETKGYFTPESRIRFKLFQHSLEKNEMCLLIKQGAYKTPMENVKAVIKIINENFMNHEPKKLLRI